MEIERKFLIPKLPVDLESHTHHHIEQGYLSDRPVVRIRREDDEYYLTYKGKGLLAREEYNLPLTEEAYLHMRQKTDGLLISKDRYFIPIENGLTVELDLFREDLAPLQMAEVEFSSEEEALAFTPPDWFGREVTYDPAYHNCNMKDKKPCTE